MNPEEKKEDKGTAEPVGCPDTYVPPAIFEIGDAIDLTKGNDFGSNIDPGPIFQRSNRIIVGDE